MKKKGVVVLGILLVLALAGAGTLGCLYWKEREKSHTADAALAEAESERVAMVAAAEDMQAELDALDADYTALTEQYESLEADIKSAGDVNAALEAENTRLAGEVDSLTARVSELETKLGDTAALDQLTDERDSLASQVAELAQQVSDLESRAEDAEGQADALNGQIVSLTEELAQAQKLADDLEPYMPPLTLPEEAALSQITVPEEISVRQDGVTAQIGFANGNVSYYSVIVRLIVDGEVVYESQPLLPSAAIDGAELAVSLTAGAHEGDLCWYIYDDEGEYVSGGRAKVTVQVS